MENEMMSNARFDRMEQHLSLIKSRNIEISDDVSQIKTAIIGNTYTGGKGIIHKIQEIRECTDTNTNDILVLKENLLILKWIASSFGALFLALVIYLITK